MTAPSTARTFAPLDVLMILLCCAGLVASVRNLPDVPGQSVEMFRDGRLVARYPLAVDREITVKGSNGPMTITVRKGRVHAVSSSCPEKICIMTGRISLPGQQIICAPNHLIVTIGTRKAPYDAIAR